jgi:hypothetical protein
VLKEEKEPPNKIPKSIPHAPSNEQSRSEIFGRSSDRNSVRDIGESSAVTTKQTATSQKPYLTIVTTLQQQK